MGSPTETLTAHKKSDSLISQMSESIFAPNRVSCMVFQSLVGQLANSRHWRSIVWQGVLLRSLLLLVLNDLSTSSRNHTESNASRGCAGHQVRYLTGAQLVGIQVASYRPRDILVAPVIQRTGQPGHLLNVTGILSGRGDGGRGATRGFACAGQLFVKRMRLSCNTMILYLDLPERNREFTS